MALWYTLVYPSFISPAPPSPSRRSPPSTPPATHPMPQRRPAIRRHKWPPPPCTPVCTDSSAFGVFTVCSACSGDGTTPPLPHIVTSCGARILFAPCIRDVIMSLVDGCGSIPPASTILRSAQAEGRMVPSVALAKEGLSVIACSSRRASDGKPSSAFCSATRQDG